MWRFMLLALLLPYGTAVPKRSSLKGTGRRSNAVAETSRILMADELERASLSHEMCQQTPTRSPDCTELSR